MSTLRVNSLQHSGAQNATITFDSTGTRTWLYSNASITGSYLYWGDLTVTRELDKYSPTAHNWAQDLRSNYLLVK